MTPLLGALIFTAGVVAGMVFWAWACQPIIGLPVSLDWASSGRPLQRSTDRIVEAVLGPTDFDDIDPAELQEYREQVDENAGQIEAAVLETETQALLERGWPPDSIVVECLRGDRPRARVKADTVHPVSGLTWWP